MIQQQAQSFSKKAGLPPGSLIHIGKSKPTKTKISSISYSEEMFEEQVDITIDQVKSDGSKNIKTWLNITGLEDIESISKIGSQYGIHKLVLEDILNTQHRPKIEEFDNYTFFTFKMLRSEKTKRRIISEQVSIILGTDFVITFQELEGDTFNSVRIRLNNKIGKIRTQGADYLLYALIDTVVDNYFSIIEELGTNIQMLEERIINDPPDDLMNEIQNYKKDLNFLKKIISPLRDSVGFICKSNPQLISQDTILYFNDTLDHILHLDDSINEMKDNLVTQMEIYLSNLSQQMNAVMKVLTIIATIFIPLTFIAGVYGMNFRYMPELDWHWGYPVVLGIMFVIFISMLLYFKRKKWI